MSESGEWDLVSFEGYIIKRGSKCSYDPLTKTLICFEGEISIINNGYKAILAGENAIGIMISRSKDSYIKAVHPNATLVNTHSDDSVLIKYAQYKVDDAESIRFYEQEFYVFSNFSSFQIEYDGKRFATSEHLYHWHRFDNPDIQDFILCAPSAHQAFKLSRDFVNKGYQIDNWNEIKIDVMRKIIKLKIDQHSYVRQKLLESGTRELIEDSWRDDFWGIGENNDGKNMLGVIWMDIRNQLFDKMKIKV